MRPDTADLMTDGDLIADDLTADDLTAGVSGI